MVATTAFVMCLNLFTTATLLTHHGVLVSSLMFRMSKTMIVDVVGLVGREQKSSSRGFLN